jgi:hypothetical protein
MFRFATDDVHAEEVQVRIIIFDTGLGTRLNRRGAEKGQRARRQELNKNSCVIADSGGQGLSVVR